MSVTSVTSRISQIEALIASVANGTTPGQAGTPGTSFSSQLQQASAATPASSATATTQAAVQPFATAASATAAVAGAVAASVPYSAQINAAAAKYNLDPSLLAGLIKQESGFDPNAQSSAGATGLTQLMPSTASSLGVTNPSDPGQAIDAGAHYLREQLDTFGGDTSKALAAYNAGPGAVQSYGGVPPYAETQNYVTSVMGFAGQFRAQSTTPAAFQPATTTSNGSTT